MGYCRITSAQKQSTKQHVTASSSGNPVFCKAKNDAFPFSEHFVNIFGIGPKLVDYLHFL